MKKPEVILENIEKQERKWKHLYKCECGKTFLSVPGNIKNGNTASCGCLKIITMKKHRKDRIIHGRIDTPEYISWDCMIQRCTNPKATGYKDYGGRDIKIIDRWLNSFEEFFKDMGLRPAGKTIDRIDNSKGYEPSNCRWATVKEQANNRRPHPKNRKN